MTDTGTALEGILGLAVGGVILLMLAPALGELVPLNLVAWGVIYIGAAVVLAVAATVAGVRAVLG